MPASRCATNHQKSLNVCRGQWEGLIPFVGHSIDQRMGLIGPVEVVIPERHRHIPTIASNVEKTALGIPGQGIKGQVTFDETAMALLAKRLGQGVQIVVIGFKPG